MPRTQQPYPPELLDALRARSGQPAAPDRVLGERFGVSPSRVRRIRRSLGVGRSRHPNAVFPDHLLPLLGTKPDADLAREGGVSKQAVGEARKSRGIPRFNHGLSKELKAP